MFIRNIERYLLQWKQDVNRCPLLFRGARQVGKTFTIEKFGHDHFENVVTINFDYQPELADCFTTLNPQKITQMLSLLTHSPIDPGKTLLFLDEIQACPNAIHALRYFKEQLPELHVIGAGSLLEFILRDAEFSIPVGRVQYLHLAPLSFQEFLSASGNPGLREQLTQTQLSKPLPLPIHERLLNLITEYSVLGGMPAVLAEYFDGGNLKTSQNVQTALLQTYRDDFGKYATRVQHEYLRLFFTKVPGLVAQSFKYTQIDREVRSRDLKVALENLAAAGLVHIVYATTASGLPLNTTINLKKLKLLFLDVGLVKRTTGLDASALMEKDLLLLNQGLLAEQFVGQELLAYQDPYAKPELFFWVREERGSSAEVNFVMQVDDAIFPLEVKSGTIGKLKSLRLFMKEKSAPIGIRISQLPLSFENGVLSVPLYLISEIPRFIRELKRAS